MNLRQFLILASTILMIITNNFYPQISELLFNQTPDAYGKYYEALTLASPQVFTFIIWAPIWLGTIAFSIYQALPRNKESELLDELLLPVLIITIFNGISLYGGYIYNIAVLCFLLLGLIWAFLIIQNHKVKHQVSFWLVEFPFSIFFGWISVALIVTVSQNLQYFGWNNFGLSEQFWLYLMISIASAIAIYIFSKFHSFTYLSVLIWAFIGILVTNFKLENYYIVGFIAVLIIVLILFALRAIPHRKNTST